MSRTVRAPKKESKGSAWKRVRIEEEEERLERELHDELAARDEPDVVEWTQPRIQPGTKKGD